jgi:exonuclease SbcC
MIKVTEIELENFGRHRHIKQKLEGNIVGLTGPNGRGKSTILQGIQFAITGMIDHPDPLSKFIRQGNRGGVAKSATVRLAFEVDGRKGVITRKITKTTTSRELTLDGLDGPVSADKRVAEIMFQLLEVDKRALGSTVFIRQGAIADMFGKDTERREFYTRLLMLGHLTKIADVVDGYRKTVASSVIDLSSVLDEAENAQNEANAAFEDAERRLKETVDCTSFLATATRLSFLFNDQTSASNTVTSESLKLGSNPEQRLLENLVIVDVNTTAIKEINDKRLSHARAETSKSEAMRSLIAAETLQTLWSEFNETSQKLEQAQNLVTTSNPADEVTVLQRKVDACTTVSTCEALVQNLTFDVELAQAQTDGAQKMLEEARLALDAVNTTVTEQQRDLDIRANILSEIEKAGHDCDAQCMVCGSNAVNASYLEKTTRELEARLRVTNESFAGAYAAHKTAYDSVGSLRLNLSCKTTELFNIQSRLKAAREVLDGTAADKDVIIAELEDAKVRAAAYAHSSAEVQRLTALYTTIAAKIASRPEPTLQEMEELRLLVHTTSAACKPWDSTLDAKESQLRSDIAICESETTAMRTAQTHLQAAKDWLGRVESELQVLCASDVQTLPSAVYDKGSVVTSNVAEEMVTKLQSMQTDYDHLRGMREAARAAMMVAQRRVIETETKIDNQKQRIELIARLVKLRDAFKPSGVSLDYLDYKFSQVATVASDYLAESGADFTVMASPGEPLAYDFIRMEPGEDWLSQSRLSGGQRVRLAVATLRAIHSLVVPNVGLLVLDEPTTHLDSDAKLAMAEMLRRIGNEGGLQILVCDHDPILIDAFTSTIEIPE